MPNTISMTQHQRLIANMDNRRKMGWAKYYESVNENHTRQVENYGEQMEVFSQIEVIESVPQFIKDEMEQMIVRLRLEIECPVCMEIIDAEGGQLEITKCGHKFCKARPHIPRRPTVVYTSTNRRLAVE